MTHIGTFGSDYRHPELDPSIYHAMELSRAPPLLNHLRQLGDFVAPTLFLGPSLKGFSLSLRSATPIFESVSILESLKVRTPSLEYLDIVGLGGVDSVQLPAVVCETARSLQHLQSLKVHNESLSFEHIHHLSLCNLVQLEVGITEDMLMHIPSAENRAQSFLTLRVLAIRARRWAIAEAFFEAYLQPSTLEKVEIEISERPSSDDVHRLLIIMHRCCSPSFLNSIAITSDFIYCLTHDKLDPSILHILFAFPNLEHLNISLSISFKEVDDMLVSAMALAWPRLKSLTLQSEYSMETTKVTIYGLFPLASCAFLQSLTIDLDAAVPNSNIGLRPDGNCSTSPLSYLSVNHAPINDPVPVALFLSCIFPNLTEIHSRKYHETDQQKLWEQVWPLYDLFLTIRKRERE